MIEVLAIAVGAAIGAPLRYLTDRAVAARHDPVFPWGTLIVNVTGSFALGVLAGLSVDGPLAALFGTGLCGALTTYSTFSHETLRLAENGARAAALANVVTSVTLGLGAAALGFLLCR